MPLYELFCMARPALARPDAAQLIRNIAGAVLNRDGVLTDIKSFGDRQLAYTIKRPGQRYEEVIHLPAGPSGAGHVDLSFISDDAQILRPARSGCMRSRRCSMALSKRSYTVAGLHVAS